MDLYYMGCFWRSPKGEGKKGTAKICHKLSCIVSKYFMTFYDVTLYDVLRQWNEETEIVIKCRKLS